MLKLSPRMFAAGAFCLSTVVLGGDLRAQLTPTPAAPRQDTLRTQDGELSNDSRAGGALSQDTPEGDAIDADAIGIDGDAVPEPRVVAGEGAEISAVVVDVSDNRLVLNVRPVGRAPARKVDFQVSDATKVTRNGEPAELMSLVPGDAVRIETAQGDPSVIVRIVATEELEGSVNSLRGNPKVVRDREGHPRVRSAGDHEEAVLPLGIEVYAVNEAALVTEMLVGGPAENAGMRIGDLIVAINGEPIPDAERIEQMVAESAGGAELTIHRGDQQVTLTVSPARVVTGALVEQAQIRQRLGGYSSVIGPVDGVVVPGGGVAVPGAGVEVEVGPNTPRGVGGAIGTDGVRTRNDQGANIDEGDPIRSPGARVQDARSPGSRVQDARSPGADTSGGGNGGGLDNNAPRNNTQNNTPAQPQNSVPQSGNRQTDTGTVPQSGVE